MRAAGRGQERSSKNDCFRLRVNKQGVQVQKFVNGVVFARPEDDEYEGMAHIWVRDAENAYWFSLSRAVGADVIEVMVSDQLTHVGDILSVTLNACGLHVRVDDLAAHALDGHLEYTIGFHPESDSFDAISETLKVIFRGKEGLVLSSSSAGSLRPLPARR